MHREELCKYGLETCTRHMPMQFINWEGCLFIMNWAKGEQFHRLGITPETSSTIGFELVLAALV